MQETPASSKRSPISVACAVIEDENGRFLVARRSESMSHPGKWEFPGGKIDAGETASAALAREIEEELGCVVSAIEALTPNVHHYPTSSIRLIPFRCLVRSGIPTAKEHSELKWATANDLQNLDWSAADLPIVAEITGKAARG